MTSDPVQVTGYLDAEDTRSTLRAVQALGAIVEPRADDLLIRGPGLRAAAQPTGPIDVGNAGTLLRLLPGWLAGQAEGVWVLDGDESIRRRPVDRIAEPLRQMGARLDAREGRFTPLTVTGSRLTGTEYELPVASAQIKSCILFAGLLASGVTRVREPAPSRDHTERMLVQAGARVERDGDRADRAPAGRARGRPHRRPRRPLLGRLPRRRRDARAGLADRARGRRGQLDARRLLPHRAADGRGRRRPARGAPGRASRPTEPIAELDVRDSALGGTVVEADEVPLAIDELPLVALLGCFAEGETLVRGAAELRLKETDRIATVVDGLRGLGASIEATEDGFAVTGTGGLRGGVMEAHGDHRLAMLGAVAGLASREGVEVVGMEAAAVSYPGFTADLERLLSPA